MGVWRRRERGPGGLKEAASSYHAYRASSGGRLLCLLCLFRLLVSAQLQSPSSPLPLLYLVHNKPYHSMDPVLLAVTRGRARGHRKGLVVDKNPRPYTAPRGKQLMNCSTPSAPEQMTICSQLRNRRARETTKGCQSPNGQATCEAHLRTGCVVVGVR